MIDVCIELKVCSKWVKQLTFRQKYVLNSKPNLDTNIHSIDTIKKAYIKIYTNFHKIFERMIT